MNVLFLDQFGELGGAQRCLLDLMPAVLTKGWNAVAAIPEGPLQQRLGIPIETLQLGNYTSGRKSLSDALRFATSMPRVAKQVADLTRRHRIDLLYVNGPRLLPAVAFTNIPALFHAQSYLPPGPSRRIAQAAIAARSIPVIAVSDFVASYIGRPATIIPNGVADTRMNRQPSPVPRIGIIGRIAPEKGHLDFIQAAQELPRDWQFQICGSGIIANPSYEVRVKAAAQGLNVHFLGWREDIAAVLANLDVLVVPSNANEASGRVILEAFAAEVPVVAYRSGGIPELIEDGRTGYLADVGDIKSLAAQIRIAATNSSEAITRQARTLWEGKYTLGHYREGVTQFMARAATNASNPAAINTGG
jgi:glycosyltransferase involved in cell wall biosynthesis